LETFPPKKKEKRQKLQDADELVSTQIWKLKNWMSLFSEVLSLPIHFKFFAMFT
jgi:hypothetical protein